MLIGVIADDFTGASDIANTLAKGLEPGCGLRTAQYAGVPTAPAPSDLEAGVISLKSRTAPVAEAVRDSLAALRWLKAQGCGQIVFKYCSTFDSTTEGNIGPVARALADALDAETVIFCPAFPAAGRTIYQGHLFVHDTLLNESGMENHPLTPMTDPDIRRWLSRQIGAPVGHLPHAIVAGGAGRIRTALSGTADRFVVADALDDADLIALGGALCDAPLITGGSGIALGLPRNFERTRSEPTAHATAVAVEGPGAILAGSCSGATRRQIDVHSATHPTLTIDVRKVMVDAMTVDHIVAFFDEHRGEAPLAYSSGAPDAVQQVHDAFGRDAVAAKLDALFAGTATALVERGFRRLVIAGGETSGAVAQAVSTAMSAPAMEIGAEIDPGVPVLSLDGAERIALALKSGNFGAEDFFAKALSMMAGART